MRPHARLLDPIRLLGPTAIPTDHPPFASPASATAPSCKHFFLPSSSNLSPTKERKRNFASLATKRLSSPSLCPPSPTSQHKNAFVTPPFVQSLNQAISLVNSFPTIGGTQHALSILVSLFSLPPSQLSLPLTPHPPTTTSKYPTPLLLPSYSWILILLFLPAFCAIFVPLYLFSSGRPPLPPVIAPPINGGKKIKNPNQTNKTLAEGRRKQNEKRQNHQKKLSAPSPPLSYSPPITLVSYSNTNLFRCF